MKLANSDSPSHAYARDALRWRPRFLANYPILNNLSLAARAANTTKQTVNVHRNTDKQFAELVAEAKENAIDLLEAVHWRRAMEGDIEPVFYMGVPVAYIHKYYEARS